MNNLLKIGLGVNILVFLIGCNDFNNNAEDQINEPIIIIPEPNDDRPLEENFEDSIEPPIVIEEPEIDLLENTTTEGPNGETIVTNVNDPLVLVNKKRHLPSDFIPEDLVIPNVQFTFEKFDEKKQMRKVAALALEKLFHKAKEEGIELYAQSGYRSYKRQEIIFNYNVNRYGEEEANRVSARPGESEHQTGLAMDVTAASVAFSLEQAFGETVEGKWVEENIAQFGFVIRYPKNKENITGYIYEPWHLRYVGVEAATEIMLEEITIEEYLGYKDKEIIEENEKQQKEKPEA